MRISNFIYIVISNLTERKWRTLFAVLVIAFAVAVALSVTAISRGLLASVQQKATEMFPPAVITIKPKTVAISILEFNSASINDDTIDKISKFKEVSQIQPQLSLKIPLRMEVEIAGQYAVTDAVVVGVDPQSMTESLRPGYTFQYNDVTSQPIPCVVPRMLLDMYNLAYADSVGFPKINEDFLVGKHFTMVLGQTYLAGGGAGTKQDKLLCRVAGLSTDASLVPGVYVPMEYARRLNEWYHGHNNQAYTALQVTLRDPNSMESVTKQLSDMGLMVEGKQWAYESVIFATRLGSALLYTFALVILLISSFSILNLFSLIMAHRIDEMRLLNAVGATKSTLRSLYFFEALAIALAGVVVGGAAIIVVLKWIESSLFDYLSGLNLSNVNMLPQKVFAFELLPTLSVVIIIVVASVISPLLISWRATGRRIAN